MDEILIITTVKQQLLCSIKIAYLWRGFVSSGSDLNQIPVVAECTQVRPLQLILLWI